MKNLLKEEMKKWKKKIGEISNFMWPYRFMFIFAFISIVFNNFHFSLEASERVYSALAVIAVLLVPIGFFSAEGFKEGLSFRGMVLLRASRIKELTICFFIFIACVPFLSHPTEPEVKTSSGTMMMISSDSGISISSDNFTNASSDEVPESGLLEGVDDWLLLLGIIGFAIWTGWSFFKLVRVLTDQSAFGEGLSDLLRELALKDHNIGQEKESIFFWNEKFSRDFVKSVKEDDTTFFSYLKFFRDYPKLKDAFEKNKNEFSSKFEDSEKRERDLIMDWITRQILNGLVTAIEENNERYFEILLSVVQEIFLKEKQLVADLPKDIYEKLTKKKKHFFWKIWKKTGKTPNDLTWFFWTEDGETSINLEVVRSAAGFLITIARDFMGTEEAVNEFKKIYGVIESSLNNSNKIQESDKDILYQFNCVVFGYLLTEFKGKFNSDFFSYRPSAEFVENFEKKYGKEWQGVTGENVVFSNLPAWIKSYKDFLNKSPEA